MKENVVDRNKTAGGWEGFGNVVGIYLSQSSNNSLIANSARYNWGSGGVLGGGSQTGIYLSSSLNNILKENKTNLNSGSSRGIGIHLQNSSNNQLINNQSNSNSGCFTGRGIYLFSSQNNLLSNNETSNNKGYGCFGSWAKAQVLNWTLHHIIFSSATISIQTLVSLVAEELFLNFLLTIMKSPKI